MTSLEKKNKMKNYSKILSFKEGSLLQKIGNILVIIFLVLLIPAVVAGIYNQIKTTDVLFEKKNFKEEVFIYEKTALIQEQVNQLHERINIDNNVTVYVVERIQDNENGRVNYYATIIANAGNPKGYENKRFWQKKLIPPGYEYFNKKVIQNGEFLINDVAKQESFYNGNTKMDCEINGTQSIYGTLIKQNKDIGEFYFIAVSFKFTNPLQETPYFVYRSNYAKDEIIKILKR